MQQTLGCLPGWLNRPRPPALPISFLPLQTAMLESDAIISYLFNTYGDGKVPLGLRLGPLTALSCGLAMLPR